MFQPHPGRSGKRSRHGRFDHNGDLACQIGSQQSFRVIAVLQPAQDLIASPNHSAIKRVIRFDDVASQTLRGCKGHECFFAMV